MSAFILSRDLDVTGETTFEGNVTMNGRLTSSYSRTVVTSNTTLTASTGDLIAVTDTSTNPTRTITLPNIRGDLVGNRFKAFTIVDESGGAGTNNITVRVSTGSNDKIIGVDSTTIAANYGSIRVYSVPNASTPATGPGNWYIAAVVPS